MICIGTQAPDFTLKDHAGKNVTPSSFKSKRVLLSFRPLARTLVATTRCTS